MMGIAESENTIDLQFEIIMEWRDQRMTYYKLKTESFVNALTEDDLIRFGKLCPDSRILSDIG